MTTHTPGPWTAIVGEHAPENLSATVKGPLGEYVADVQWRGNGRLIAAAPQLLEVCEAIARRYNHDDRLGGLGDWLADVIALATGEPTDADRRHAADYFETLRERQEDHVPAEMYRRQEPRE